MSRSGRAAKSRGGRGRVAPPTRCSVVRRSRYRPGRVDPPGAGCRLQQRRGGQARPASGRVTKRGPRPVQPGRNDGGCRWCARWLHTAGPRPFNGSVDALRGPASDGSVELSTTTTGHALADRPTAGFRNMPAVDGVAFVAPHPGQGILLLNCIAPGRRRRGRSAPDDPRAGLPGSWQRLCRRRRAVCAGLCGALPRRPARASPG